MSPFSSISDPFGLFPYPLSPAAKSSGGVWSGDGETEWLVVGTALDEGVADGEDNTDGNAVTGTRPRGLYIGVDV